MAGPHEVTFKTLIHFLEEAVTWTSDARQRLSYSRGEVNQLLHNWNPPQSIKLDAAVYSECSNKNDGIKEGQRVEETCNSSKKTKNKTKNVVGRSSACLKSTQGETIGKKSVSIHSQSKEFTSSTGNSSMLHKGIQEKDRMTENLSPSASESKDPLRKKMLVKFRQNPLVPRTTYQSDYSTLKPTTYSKQLQNANSINITARNSQVKEKISESLTGVKSESTRKYINEKHGNRQTENGKLKELNTVGDKLENNKVKPMYLTLEEAVEELNICSTSSELVRNFGLHYSFLHNIEEKRDHPAAAQNAAASAAFLKLFSELNKTIWLKNLSEPLGRLFADTMSLSNKLFDVHSCISRTDVQEELELRNIYERMEKQFLRLSNQDNIVHTVSRSRSTPQRSKHTTPCQNMGLWYWRKTAIFDGLNKKLHLVYKDEKQWQKLQENLQLIERLQFQIDVFDLILSEMIPRILSMDPNTKNFQMMLKVVWAVTDFTRLPVPVFIIP
ncbi:uncharacterized protein LOC126475379 [Schistocerca serialis cubense]|uniref:uncharacterized protein LOC126475379 n=1 Tax=Schistocerca serialis cubense TaxID=2023355 RepID=UPI00214EF1E3|nr:uncharacterized protein LOC126475379 [Schistocerca serialis cubense]